MYYFFHLRVIHQACQMNIMSYMKCQQRIIAKRLDYGLAFMRIKFSLTAVGLMEIHYGKLLKSETPI